MPAGLAPGLTRPSGIGRWVQQALHEPHCRTLFKGGLCLVGEGSAWTGRSVDRRAKIGGFKAGPHHGAIAPGDTRGLSRKTESGAITGAAPATPPDGRIGGSKPSRSAGRTGAAGRAQPASRQACAETRRSVVYSPNLAPYHAPIVGVSRALRRRAAGWLVVGRTAAPRRAAGTPATMGQIRVRRPNASWSEVGKYDRTDPF